MSEILAQYQTVNQDILNLAAASLSAAPDLTEAERTARYQTVIRRTMAFQPTDMVQTMLASLIVGHHLSIMDGIRDLACLTLTPAEAANARTVIVEQAKVVLEMLSEMQIARAEASNQTAPRGGEPAQGAAGDAEFEAYLDRFRTAYTNTLATLEDGDTLTPAAAAMARETLGQILSPAFFAASREEKISTPATGSRAQRRAMMKRRGGFKRNA